jgi:hypothetical protein
MDFNTDGKHLIIDGLVITVFVNSIMSKVASVPRLAAKKAEDAKFKVDKISGYN